MGRKAQICLTCCRGARPDTQFSIWATLPQARIFKCVFHLAALIHLSDGCCLPSSSSSSSPSLPPPSSSSPLCLLPPAWHRMEQHGSLHVAVAAEWARKSAVQLRLSDAVADTW